MEEEKKHYIRAENRRTGIRERVTENMTKKDANSWQASYQDKKYHKWFRVVKDK